MFRIRTFVVGRDPGCDVQLDHASVSRRHAEVVCLPGGRLYVTDRATTNGTFVLDGGAWRTIRQTFLDPTGRIRFGEFEMSAGRLAGLCPRDDARSFDDGGDAGRSLAPDDDELDPDRGLVRDPETGELREREPPANVRRRR